MRNCVLAFLHFITTRKKQLKLTKHGKTPRDIQKFLFSFLLLKMRPHPSKILKISPGKVRFRYPSSLRTFSDSVPTI
jgi:hypothetical protein